MAEPAGPEAPLPPPPPPAGPALLVALILGQIGLHASMAGLRLAAPLQLLREGYSAWSVGLLLALFGAAPVFLALHAGRLADRHGYHRPVKLAVLLCTSGMLLALASTTVQGGLHFGLLAAAAMLAGTAANMGVLTIQRTAGLLGRDATHRVRLYSLLGVAPSLSNVVGPVAVGFVIDAAGFAWAYAMLVLFPVVSWISARQVPRMPAATALAGPEAPRGKAWDLLATPGLKRLFTINFLLATCWDVHLFAVPLLGHERGFSASTIGLILGTFTASVTVVRLVLPLVAHRLREAATIRAAMLGTMAVFIAFPLMKSPGGMMLCSAVLGLSLGAVQPMVMSTLHHLSPATRHGEALALRSMVMHLASSVMPLVFGASGAWVGAGALFWLVGGAVGAGSWLTRRLATVAR